MLDTPSQTSAPRTILVVEDEPDLATAIAQRIAARGWKARVVCDGVSAVKAALSLKPDLIIMDIMLPVMDGIEATRRIVSKCPIPVLMLTARDSEADKLAGLSAGADDYVTKPFSPRELIARCGALLRRVERAAIIAKREQYNTLIKFGNLIIDTKQRLVTIGEKAIHFTPTEFSLLTTFANHPHEVLKRETLLEKVWDWPDASGTRTVDSHVKSLRHKIGSDWIRTIHGVGYAFEPPKEDYEPEFDSQK
ncbi:putative alkaline phosphatase synthesis transcriptional regulatory protein PhoP [Gardnerella vaginalis JCP8151B]|nr:putative alkaline phosphatase synthesis transcriptional regulatory protein PhoP [Gardnerella vaginalis JCP8151B]